MTGDKRFTALFQYLREAQQVSDDYIHELVGACNHNGIRNGGTVFLKYL